MDTKHGFNITIRDRVFYAWQKSMELVNNYEAYANETDNPDMIAIFKRLSKDLGEHASVLHEILVDTEENQCCTINLK